VEIGNQICYSRSRWAESVHFQELQNKWSCPTINEDLRLQRFTMVKAACNYDLDHIPFFIKRTVFSST
jgi:hypothetical protein